MIIDDREAERALRVEREVLRLKRILDADRADENRGIVDVARRLIRHTGPFPILTEPDA